MKFKKTVSVFLLLAMCLGVFAGCSSDENTNGDSGADSAGTSDTGSGDNGSTDNSTVDGAGDGENADNNGENADNNGEAVPGVIEIARVDSIDSEKCDLTLYALPEDADELDFTALDTGSLSITEETKTVENLGDIMILVYENGGWVTGGPEDLGEGSIIVVTTDSSGGEVWIAAVAA